MQFTSVAAYLAICLVVLCLRLSRRRKSIQQIRGPPAASSLLGHEYELNQEDQVGDLEFRWLKEYGPTWRIKGAFGTDALMTADPKALQHIYHKSAYNYVKKRAQNIVSYMMVGPGIVHVEGVDHQRHRKLMNPAFSASQLRSFLPLFQRNTGRLVEKWKAELTSSSELELVINTWISRITLDIIGEAAFDYNYNTFEDADQSTLAKAYHSLFKDTEYRLPKSTTLFRASWDYIPVPLLKLLQYIPMQPLRRMYNLKSLFAAYGKQILRAKGTQVDTEKQAHNKDVLSILIKANCSSDAKTRLSDAELMAQMSTLTLAGHETTSNTVTFLLYELANHPEYQTRMREEIRESRARIKARGDVDFRMEDLDSMTTCLNAIKETLRVHPIATGLHRVAAKDDVLPLAYPIISASGETITEIPVSKGQVILTSFATYNRLPQVWGEDAHVWNPDRFCKLEAGKQTNVGVFANLMTFSAGTRACIGWRFSVIEMQALIAELVEAFQFRPPVGSGTEKPELQRAPSGLVMIPLIRGKEELGPAMPLRIALVE
ncbi:PAH-inducible cytochrome P450 monooxygenase PC-PAH 4 [Pilatotrama ljubarskyi]|nr:PAH-inducible cytochrome P450 monooxygenase PC-PAH 4 [Pilatotrama ljubarskyi]